MIVIAGLSFFCMAFFYFRFNLYNHQVGLLLSWSVIFLMANAEVSYLHRFFEIKTFAVVFLFLGFYLLGARVSNFYFKRNNSRGVPEVIVSNKRYLLVFCFYLFLTLLNVAMAGYIPLVEMFLTGDSKYVDFGVSGVYGFYCAFANAFAVVSYYLYLKSGARKYLYAVFVVVVWFALFVTRQNIISVLVEIFIVHGFVRGYLSRSLIAIASLAALLVFVVIGDFRTDDIRGVVEAKSQYAYLPSAFFWVYSYFYITGVNLNNSINFSNAPYYDYSSFSALIPNTVKSLFGWHWEHDYFFEKVNFNVSTALQPMYSDFGMPQVIVLGFVFGFATHLYYLKASFFPNFKNAAIYSVLFFCAFFSFFVNFWFYLPVIFQIPFICFFSRIIVKSRAVS